MTTTAFVGKVFLNVGNGATPEVFAQYCEIDSMAGIGVKNDLVDVTTFCSGGSKEYVGGLSDGKEVTFGANYSTDEPIQESLMLDVDNKVTRNFTVTVENGAPATVVKTFALALAMLDWEFNPSVSKQNVIKFIGKITGPIVRT
jgi:hypothetical protein